MSRNARVAEAAPGRSINRRHALAAMAGFVVGAKSARAEEELRSPITFGLTPVFLANDLELLAALKGYLETATQSPVQLVLRRTYQEITALLVSGQLDAAWICGYPYVVHQDQLALVAVPVWRGQPLYQSYVICAASRPAASFDELGGDIHAFSDPDSNSGYLVTSALLAERGLRPDRFFRKTFFTYGHRNVVRAVAAGLADSGSVDGYVWEVMREIEPALTAQTKIVRRSEWLGFPPIACSREQRNEGSVKRLARAFDTMTENEQGRAVLHLLRLDRFEQSEPSLFRPIAAKFEQIRRLG